MTRDYMPVGFRFRPTDQEIIKHYLMGKNHGKTFDDIIPEVDVCRCEPWDLPRMSRNDSDDPEWFFFSPRDRKYPTGNRSNRATEAGYWKATGKDRLIKSHQSHSNFIGSKKTLVFYEGRAPNGVRTNWIIHEYQVSEGKKETGKGAYVLCRLFKKPSEETTNSFNAGHVSLNSDFPNIQAPSSELDNNSPIEQFLNDLEIRSPEQNLNDLEILSPEQNLNDLAGDGSSMHSNGNSLNIEVKNVTQFSNEFDGIDVPPKDLEEIPLVQSSTSGPDFISETDLLQGFEAYMESRNPEDRAVEEFLISIFESGYSYVGDHSFSSSFISRDGFNDTNHIYKDIKSDQWEGIISDDSFSDNIRTMSVMPESQASGIIIRERHGQKLKPLKDHDTKETAARRILLQKRTFDKDSQPTSVTTMRMGDDDPVTVAFGESRHHFNQKHEGIKNRKTRCLEETVPPADGCTLSMVCKPGDYFNRILENPSIQVTTQSYPLRGHLKDKFSFDTKEELLIPKVISSPESKAGIKYIYTFRAAIYAVLLVVAMGAWIRFRPLHGVWYIDI